MPATPTLILPTNLLALFAWVLLALPSASAAPVKNVNVVAVADNADISQPSPSVVIA